VTRKMNASSLQHVNRQTVGAFKETRCIKKFPDWPPGARTVNGIALCQYVQLYNHFVSQYSEFCRHNPFVASQRLFIVVSVYFVMTQSGNFWIHPRVFLHSVIVLSLLYPGMTPVFSFRD
jgi:hypothetical protein